MQNYYQIEQNFINYLLDEGYPRESIVVNLRVGNFVADIALVDLKTNLPIAIFELKQTSGPIERIVDITIFEEMKKASVKDIHYYYVIAKAKKFKFLKFSGILSGNEKTNTRELQDLPSYKDMQKIPSNIREKKRIKKIDFIKYWIIFCTILLILLLMIDIFCESNIITYERILFVVIIINLPFLPYITEFGFGSLSIKKNSKQDTRPE